MSWFGWLVAVLAIFIAVLWYIENRPVKNEEWNLR